MVPHEIPGPAYRVRTERMILRCWEPGDAELLKDAIDVNLDHLRPGMPWAMDEPQELQTKIERLRRWRRGFDLGQDFVYGLFAPDEREVLGASGLHTRAGDGACEIGYWIHAHYINRGLATEVAGALTRVAFEVDSVRRVEIHCDPRNVRSAAVPRKLGFVYEATLRQRVRDSQGALRDTMVWTLLQEEYRASAAAAVGMAAFDVPGCPMA
jgi:RimJ/RimL family protein N-acetyltransferase